MLSVSNISLEDQTLILINCLIIIPSYFLIISPKYRGEIKINQFYFPSDVQQCQVPPPSVFVLASIHDIYTVII